MKRAVGTTLTGFLTLIPVIGIIEIGGYFKVLFHSLFGFMVPDHVSLFGVQVEPLVTVFMGITFCLLIGWGVTSISGKRLFDRLHSWFEKMPFIGAIYLRVMDTFGLSKEGESIFKQPVLIDLCDSQEIGFITKENHPFTGEGKVAVYVPGVPIPANGRLIFVKEQYIERLDIDNKQAMHAIFTIGNDELFSEVSAG